MQLDDLKAEMQFLMDAVEALRGQVVALQNAGTAEIARVEEVIAILKQSSIDPKELEPITAQLQTTVDNLKAQQATLASTQSALDAEQPAPVPPPAQAAGA